MSAGSCRRSPAHTTSTRTPVSLAAVAASRSMPSRPGAGAADTGSLRRRATSVRRRAARVSRLVASMARRASRACAGCVSMTRLPTPAWMAITPMLWATMSCNSRAMRSRSSVRACSVERACACAADSRPRRTESPISQARTTIGSWLWVRMRAEPVTGRANWAVSSSRTVMLTADRVTRRDRVAATTPSATAAGSTMAGVSAGVWPRKSMR